MSEEMGLENLKGIYITQEWENLCTPMQKVKKLSRTTNVENFYINLAWFNFSRRTLLLGDNSCKYLEFMKLCELFSIVRSHETKQVAKIFVVKIKED